MALPPLPEHGSWPEGTRPQALGRLPVARHVLVVPGDVAPDEVELLALSRFAQTRHLREPGDGEPGVLRTSRLTSLVGPYAPPEGPAQAGPDADADLPQDGFAVDVLCPRERGSAPWPGTSDPDGVVAAFADGLPEREEGRVVTWLVDAARRLRGVVLVDGRAVVRPDPEANIDLAIFSDVWLDPAAALAVLRAADPRAVFAPGGVEWTGRAAPGDDAVPRPGVAPGRLAPATRRAIHEAADAYDMAVLADPPARSGFAVHVGLGSEDLVAVEIAGEDVLPVSLRGLPWAATGAIAYRVRWIPAEDVVPTVPSRSHRRRRTVGAGVVARLTAALHAAVGGEIVDQGDFLVDPVDLVADPSEGAEGPAGARL
ncbi:MAG: hypothetical protein ACTMIR_07500 [Cellulomonadaceae bacterium]